jgi:hypothetical protein
MMAQVSDVSKTCEHALETHEPSRIGRPAKPFSILEVCDPQRYVGHVAAPDPSHAGRWDSEPQGTWQRRSPPEQGGGGLDLWGTCQHRSPPDQGGGVRCYGTHDSARALLSREARSGAVGHMAAPKPSQVGRQNPEL